MIRKLTLFEIKHVSVCLAQEMLSFNEPIPDFSTRFPNVLESCLATPFQTYIQRSLYPTLTGKAAILFYLMIKNHPFQNGNKRIAMTTLFDFLYKNGKWLKIDNHELYKFTMWIADSPPSSKDEAVRAIVKLLAAHMIRLK